MLMKKSSIALFALFFLLLPSRAFAYHIRAGGYVAGQTPIGEANNYFAEAFGGGICGEFGFSETFGELIRLQYSGIVPKDSALKSAWQLSQYICIWYSIPFSDTGISFTPSVELGLMFQGAKTIEGYGELPQKAYTDFTFQFCPAFRYKSEKILNNKLEIEASPALTFILQKTGGLAFFGIRLGALYVF